MKFEFIPVDYDYFDFDGRNYVRMVGRNKNRQKVCVIDFYEANFYLILKDGADANKVMEKIEKIEVGKASRITRILRMEVLNKKYFGKDVKAIRVFVSNHKDAHDIASAIGEMGEVDNRREYDIPLITKYIKEKGIEPLKWNSVDGEILGVSDFGGLAKALDIDVCVLAKNIVPMKKEKEFIPKILAYDIETDEREIGKGKILMVSVYGEDVQKVFSWKKIKGAKDYVVFCKNEAETIEKFSECVRSYNADILTGYFSDGFDLPYLKARADINKVNLNLGIDGREPSFIRGRISSGRICGLVHVDLYRFVDAVFSQYLQSETLSLSEVAKELTGEDKKDFDFARMGNMRDSDWIDFFSYNLQDSAMAYKLALKIWPDLLEFCRIVKEPLFDVSRDRMATHVENYILHNLDRFNEIAEKRPGYDEIGDRKDMGKYEGAFVFEPVPGLYEDLVMFDFTSMYASVIVTYNLSKSSFLGGGKFSKDLSFFPVMLNEIIEKRKEHKKEFARNKSGILRARSNAYKLLANSAYGYQGFFGARYYCREAAAATARLAKENILKAIDTIEKAGYKIIYSDTDSICFLRGEKSYDDIFEFLEKINSKLPGIMELDLEGFFKRGLFVAKRGVIAGAKKKYALVDEDGRMKVRGFETVRRDWCNLTRRLQSEILGVILKNGDEKEALEILKNAVNKLKDRNIDLEDLMIRTQLRRPLNEYVSEGPHVIAAKRMIDSGVLVSSGMLIEYYIGDSAGKKIGDRVYLAGEKVKYDIDYYLKNQILPAVENIFDVFGVDVGAVIEGESQKKLF